MSRIKDLIEEDIPNLEETPFSWLQRASDADFRSMAKENSLSVVVFGIYGYVVMRVAQLSQQGINPWDWFIGFLAQLALVFSVSWILVNRWKGGRDILEVDFYRVDGSRATGQVLLSGQPQNITIGYLRESISRLRESYAKVKQQRIHRKEVEK